DLVQVDDRLILSIEDDGAGIGSTPATEGMGLQIMQHRAGTIGATLTAEPGTHGGTIVTCTLAALTVGRATNQETEQ
ncbi:MAG TPA: hypothetical protein VN541_05515, partial [Tepidisphaeraceae bacterium]|nr:hypothetical protein [Tepidisphaeraceae bacterium]